MLPATGWRATEPTTCATAPAPAVVQVAVNEPLPMPDALTVSVGEHRLAVFGIGVGGQRDACR